ncbi:hypothetical protein Hanom_Chr02g00139261 [Helianthus anomalus]
MWSTFLSPSFSGFSTRVASYIFFISFHNDVFFWFFPRMLSPLAIYHADIKATSSAVSHLVVCGCFSVCCDV